MSSNLGLVQQDTNQQLDLSRSLFTDSGEAWPYPIPSLAEIESGDGLDPDADAGPAVYPEWLPMPSRATVGAGAGGASAQPARWDPFTNTDTSGCDEEGTGTGTNTNHHPTGPRLLCEVDERTLAELQKPTFVVTRPASGK
eukprot:TRINITY_DN299_c0_g2_i1.p2 TRINITY_DN299_c0_g2~~TRINITY_DN299_c0_g2_i1.p2  ORF type:complete len:141 (-),score=23.28 TRINITY_DN299_c0_g2_i1:147-569(-)